MGEYDQEKKEVLGCAKWMSEHGYFGGYRGSGEISQSGLKVSRSSR
jgi:hypothetical protein